MFDDDGAIQALTAQAQLNQPTQPKEPTLFQGSWAAVAKIIPAAAGETVRAFNQMATPAAMTEEKKSRLAEKFGADFAEYEAARRAEAIQEHDQVGSSLGRFVKSMTPDAQSSGTAAQIIHGIGKTVGKAVGYSVAGGLPGIAVGLSSDEGINESLRLQDAGVDQATANQAGVVRAATTAVSVALPGAGPTLAKTVGLVATAGPAAFMADQAAIKHILESANYAEKAKEYDPYDLTNLLISSVPGAVIGGIHLRGRAKAGTAEVQARDASDLVVKEEVNVQNDAAGITAAADQEAAARVMQVDTLLQRKALTPLHDLAGQIDHQSAMDYAARQFNDGTPIDVRSVLRSASDADAIPIESLANARLLDESGARLERERAELLPDVGNIAEPGAIVGIRDEVAALLQTRASFTDDALKTLAKQIQADEQVSYKSALSKAKKETEVRSTEIDRRISALEDQLETNRIAAEAAKRLADIDERIARIRDERAGIAAPTPKAGAIAVRQALKDIATSAGENRSLEVPQAREKGAATVSAEQSPRADQLEVEDAYLDQPIVIAKAEDGTPITTTGREMLEDVRNQQIQADNDSKSFLAAIECFISSGDMV